MNPLGLDLPAIAVVSDNTGQNQRIPKTFQTIVQIPAALVRRAKLDVQRKVSTDHGTTRLRTNCQSSPVKPGPIVLRLDDTPVDSPPDAISARREFIEGDGDNFRHTHFQERPPWHSRQGEVGGRKRARLRLGLGRSLRCLAANFPVPFFVVLGAEPHHIERLRVILVMRLHVLNRPTPLAGLFHKPTAFDGVLNLKVRLPLLRCFRTGCPGSTDRREPRSFTCNANDASAYAAGTLPVAERCSTTSLALLHHDTGHRLFDPQSPGQTDLTEGPPAWVRGG